MSPLSADQHLERIRLAVVASPVYRDVDALRSAPSDVLDGWAFAREVQPLVDQGILGAEPVEPRDRTLGNEVSWHFTDKGLEMARAWLAPSDRAEPEASAPRI
ncbi:hypothetical protein BHAOGJBA_4204 [Methylobacterium hispanicum]|uniref:ArsR family transcriptional regulator n=1 Tax=Methylobacterium hispanicum TaxID=270350 RepID=A0AAV4ZR53_9HYPH|nr:hypothetical protein [Methylobacterium hispanicum]GJD90662.1 hypothetical protein BHAOGJBA_4204 [Methylobacterium hispanicum]